MKLLELLPKLERYGRVKREEWGDWYLIKQSDENKPLVLCDFHCMTLREFIPSFESLVSDDWEIIN